MRYISKEDAIREGISKLSGEIRITVSMSRPKIVLDNVPAKICGVYPHMFILEFEDGGVVKRHSFRYSDVLIEWVKIAELNV